MIVGITGTIGSGKGAVSEMLVERGFKQLVMSDVLREELRKEGKEENRDNMLAKGNEMREKFGSGVLMERLLAKAEQEGYEKVIIDGLRSVGEVEELKKAGGVLVAVDAPVETRYERAVKRKSSKDNIDLEKFKEQQKAEFDKPGAIGDCVRKADFDIFNDGNFDDLKEKVKEILSKLE